MHRRSYPQLSASDTSTPASMSVSVVLEGENEILDFGTTLFQSVPYALHTDANSPWEVREDRIIVYPSIVRSGPEPSPFGAVEGFQVGRTDKSTITGFTAINSHPESRSLILLGQGRLSNYLQLTYNNTEAFRDESPRPLVTPGTANLFTGAPRGLQFISQRNNIRFYSGQNWLGPISTLSISTTGNVGIGTDVPIGQTHQIKICHYLANTVRKRTQ